MVEDALGRRMDLMGRKVALTTGGAGGNPEMFERLHGVPMYARLAYPFNLGGGLEMGVGAGGVLRGAELFTTFFGMVLNDFNVPSTPAGVPVNSYPERRMPWEVYVNSAGQRFVREDHPSVDEREHALLAQREPSLLDDLRPGNHGHRAAGGAGLGPCAAGLGVRASTTSSRAPRRLGNWPSGPEWIPKA